MSIETFTESYMAKRQSRLINRRNATRQSTQGDQLADKIYPSTAAHSCPARVAKFLMGSEEVVPEQGKIVGIELMNGLRGQLYEKYRSREDLVSLQLDCPDSGLACEVFVEQLKDGSIKVIIPKLIHFLQFREINPRGHDNCEASDKYSHEAQLIMHTLALEGRRVSRTEIHFFEYAAPTNHPRFRHSTAEIPWNDQTQRSAENSVEKLRRIREHVKDGEIPQGVPDELSCKLCPYSHECPDVYKKEDKGFGPIFNEENQIPPRRENGNNGGRVIKASDPLPLRERRCTQLSFDDLNTPKDSSPPNASSPKPKEKPKSFPDIRNLDIINADCELMLTKECQCKRNKLIMRHNASGEMELSCPNCGLQNAPQQFIINILDNPQKHVQEVIRYTPAAPPELVGV